MTDEEKEEIINKAVERALLMLPEVVGNLMAQHAVRVKTNTKFYKDNPDFAYHKDTVAAVVEEEEAKQPSHDYEKLLYECIPAIRRRIALTNSIPKGTPNGTFK